ncbi:ABC transporter ATP-binding protein [Planctellipticum variicoloris]|uniref:ABC transporter ATP-binding protein n=1 Tax=Planctellipticum variicoloris TaxID=3064265 RepID=UPI003014087B|nr:ABC transporter ATP-binding protein [Planctomycetaceae bacterium SH412]
MPKPVITVENLSKAYRIGLKEEIPDTLVSAMSGMMKAPFRKFRDLRKLDTFGHSGADEEDIYWALKDVSFEVQEGEVLGVIGRNGAGKSTLLKILSRITEPTSGRAVIRGRVSSLLEVGTGFHPELSGRENVYLNGTILGMTKREIDRKFDEIVDFSGIDKFLDTPIKRYSSGMKVRLAFAVAAHLEPEILIIDEVLAVGDMEFQKKCLGKMQDVAKGGRTVLFVSHSMAAVRSLCSHAILLTRGSIEHWGDTECAISRYLGSVTTDGKAMYVQSQAANARNGFVELDKIELLNSEGQLSSTFEMDESIIVKVTYRGLMDSGDFHVFVWLHREDGTAVLGSASWDIIGLGNNPLRTGLHSLECTIPPRLLNAARYTITVNGQFPGHGYLFEAESALVFEIAPVNGVGGPKSWNRPGIVRPLLPWRSSAN